MIRQDEQIVLRVSAPLRRELEVLAAGSGVPLALYVRRLLIDHAAALVIERAQSEAKAA